jgi:hypothetical protein
MNSAFTVLPTLLPALGNSTAVANVESDIEEAVIYPNPAYGKSYLAVRTKKAGNTILTITDITGRTLYSRTQSVHLGKNTIELETSNLTSGSYFVNFATEEANVVLKLNLIH